MNGTEEIDGMGKTATLSAWRALAVDWDLTAAERGELLPRGGERDFSPPSDTRARMRTLIEIGYRLRFDSVVELRDWLRRPTPMFALDAPLDVMSGAMTDLLRFRDLVERGLGS